MRRPQAIATGCALAAFTALSVGAAQADETGGAGGPTTVEVLALGSTDQPFTIRSRKARDFHFRKAVMQPGASTGWHFHTGEEVAVIASGTLTRFGGDCGRQVLREGDALVEPAGRDEVHLGVNLSTEPVELYVADLVPAGRPIVRPAADPGCPIP
ncbi:MAG: cupin domain-containing protein, partial [Thermocrispum sp.]